MTIAEAVKELLSKPEHECWVAQLGSNFFMLTNDRRSLTEWPQVRHVATCALYASELAGNNWRVIRADRACKILEEMGK